MIIIEAVLFGDGFHRLLPMEWCKKTPEYNYVAIYDCRRNIYNKAHQQSLGSVVERDKEPDAGVIERLLPFLCTLNL